MADRYKKPENRGRRPVNNGNKQSSTATILLFVALLCALTFFVWKNATVEVETHISAPPSGQVSNPSPSGSTPTLDPNLPPDAQPTPEPLWDFAPHSVESTLPSKLIRSTNVQIDGQMVESFAAAEEERIDFGFGRDYTNVEGILTFRGNNFRDSASYGIANIVQRTMQAKWQATSSALTAPDGETWTGSGWVGQPLIVKWPAETRRIMNMYDWAKNKDDLVEVIYATMDGYVYFLDLDTGEKTRDSLFLGFTFKGAGALDPRGYPILYLGAGYNSSRGASRAFIVSLIDGSVMYEFGNGDSFALRPWPMFDGSPLVDAETDQLIYPSENGVIYIIKLNTQYDPQAGTLSVNPTRMLKWRYNGVRTGGAYWLGMEASPVIWRGHLITPDNGGNLICIDLNTLEIVWAQDVLDDTNCTPVLELENGHPYIYISTSFHDGWRAYAGQTAPIPIWKIDAVTGEVIWRRDYDCHTVNGTSGGVQGTLAIGKHNLSDLIFVPVARTPSGSAGLLVALDKQTGEEIWRVETMMYAWSSPVAVYDAEGNGYIILCTTGGYMYLLDGRTGEAFAHLDLGSNIEASPAVYNSTAVVGTRGQKIWGISLQ